VVPADVMNLIPPQQSMRALASCLQFINARTDLLCEDINKALESVPEGLSQDAARCAAYQARQYREMLLRLSVTFGLGDGEVQIPVKGEDHDGGLADGSVGLGS